MKTKSFRVSFTHKHAVYNGTGYQIITLDVHLDMLFVTER